MATKFEVYPDRGGKFRWRLKAGNGEIVAQGEAYESKSGAKEGCEAGNTDPHEATPCHTP